MNQFFNKHPTARIHPLAFVDESAEIGEDVVIWQFASVLKGVKLGKGVSIGAGSEIGAGTVIGRDSRISAQVFLPSNSRIEDRVFIGPRCVFCDDRHPFAGNPNYIAEPPTLHSGCSVGAGSVVLPGVTMGVGSSSGAGAIITRDVPAHAHVRGEPARVKPYSRIREETHFDIYSQDMRQRFHLGAPSSGECEGTPRA